MHVAARSTSTPQAVDNTDWLKTAAIILVFVDHFGYFFMEDDLWWSAFGRLAAPPFFFLIGYAQTRTVPLHWIGLGVILTLLDSWNADWTWVAPNILLSFALIRFARPYVQILVQRHGWVAFALLVCRTCRGAADSGEDCRLRRGGMAVGPVRLIPSPVCRRQISCRRGRRIPKLGTTRARDDGERGPHASAGLLCRRGRLRLAGTKGILVSSELHFAVFILGVGVLSAWPVSIPARPEPHPTAGSHRRRPALHRPAHSGNLRHPACRLRAHRKVGARSRPLTRDRTRTVTPHIVARRPSPCRALQGRVVVPAAGAQTTPEVFCWPIE